MPDLVRGRISDGFSMAFVAVCKDTPFALFVLLVPRSIAFLAMVLMQSLMLVFKVLLGGTGYTSVRCCWLLVMTCARMSIHAVEILM